MVPFTPSLVLAKEIRVGACKFGRLTNNQRRHGPLQLSSPLGKFPLGLRIIISLYLIMAAWPHKLDPICLKKNLTRPD